jgi:hypothetical protein
MILKTTERSTFLDLARMDWTPSGFPGVWTKVLYEDPLGRRTTLTRFEPGATLPPRGTRADLRARGLPGRR